MTTTIRDQLVGKIIVTGILCNTSSLIMGKGEGDIIDIEVQKGYDGKAYIPGPSFTGALKNYFFKYYKTEIALNPEQFNYMWGEDTADDNSATLQSHFQFEDSLPITEGKIVLRDGIRIETYNGITEDKKKFVYEVLETGCEFNFKLEVVLRKGSNEKLILQTIKTIIKDLESENIKAGKMTTCGFGVIKLSNPKVFKLDFINDNNDGVAWLKYAEKEEIGYLNEYDIRKTEPFTSTRKEFIARGEFRIKSSLIVGTYSSDITAADKVHISSGGKPLMPGRTKKGSIRGRAIRIINTLGGDGEALVNSLFGWAEDNKDKGKATKPIKSRVYTSETIIENVESKTPQDRGKLSRFTQANSSGALFSSQPVFRKNDDKSVIIAIKIVDYEPWEAGLILFILKDLCNADLPIGGEKNIGRGVLEALKLEIKWKEYKFVVGKEGKLDGDSSLLNGFGAALSAKIKELSEGKK